MLICCCLSFLLGALFCGLIACVVVDLLLLYCRGFLFVWFVLIWCGLGCGFGLLCVSVFTVVLYCMLIVLY